MSSKQVDNAANRIRKAMELRGMKQADIVEQTGINKGSLSCYLSGKYEPKQMALYKMGKVLGVSEMWLAGYDVPMERTQVQKANDAMADIIVRMRTDQNFFAIIEKINNLDDAQLKAIETMILAFNK